MTTVTYVVPAIHCHHCVRTIENELAELAGVQEVKADLESRQVTVTFAPPADEAQIRSLLAGINYPAAG